MARFTNAFNKLKSLVSLENVRKEEIQEAKTAYDEVLKDRRMSAFDKPKRKFDPDNDAVVVIESSYYYDSYESKSDSDAASTMFGKSGRVDIHRSGSHGGTNAYRGYGIEIEGYNYETHLCSVGKAKKKLGVKGKIWEVFVTVGDNKNLQGSTDEIVTFMRKHHNDVNVSRHTHWKTGSFVGTQYLKSILPNNCTDSEYALILSKEHECTYSESLAWVKSRAQWKHERSLGFCLQTIDELGIYGVLNMRRFTNRSLPKRLSENFTCPRAEAHIDVCKSIINGERANKKEALRKAHKSVRKFMRDGKWMFNIENYA